MNGPLLPASDRFSQARASIAAAVKACAGFELPVMPTDGGLTSPSREQRRLAIVREAIRDGHPLHHLEECFDWLDNVGEEPSR